MLLYSYLKKVPILLKESPLNKVMPSQSKFSPKKMLTKYQSLKQLTTKRRDMLKFIREMLQLLQSNLLYLREVDLLSMDLI
jgi:hypothetical protein